jgi:hypothetical protein
MPTMSDIISESKKHYACYSKMKKKFTNMVWAFAVMSKVRKAELPIVVHIMWHEKKGSRRDPDNVAAAKKFILDGIVKAGVIPNDSHKWICKTVDMYKYNQDKYLVEVFLEEVEYGNFIR